MSKIPKDGTAECGVCQKHEEHSKTESCSECGRVVCTDCVALNCENCGEPVCQDCWSGGCPECAAATCESCTEDCCDAE